MVMEIYLRRQARMEPLLSKRRAGLALEFPYPRASLKSSAFYFLNYSLGIRTAIVLSASSILSLLL